MKKISLFIVAAMCATAAFSQTATTEKAKTIADTVKIPKKWTRSGAASINMSQASFSNWSAGGDNSVAGTAAFGYKIGYKNGKHTWDNSLDIAYGLTFQDSEKRKNDDRLEIASKYGYQLSKYWFLSSLVQFKTQMDKGYASYPKNGLDFNSRFFAPAYLTVMPIGFDYRPNENFSVSMSPTSFKFTIVSNRRLADLGLYAEKGKRFYTEFGAYIRASYAKDFFEKRMALKTKLELFSAYTHQPLNVDINWEVDIDFKVTKWLSTKFYAQMLYDNDIKRMDKTGLVTGGPRVQLKQILGIGLSFIF